MLHWQILSWYPARPELRCQFSWHTEPALAAGLSFRMADHPLRIPDQRFTSAEKAFRVKWLARQHPSWKAVIS
jgi:hypothetical protein